MILVTGGAGFIGSNIVAELSASGADILVCDCLREGEKWRNLAKHRVFDFVFPEDLFVYLAECNSKIDAAIHMGAISATTVTDGDAVMRSNFQFSRKLWDWCTESQTSFIYASSAATYGDGAQGFGDNWDSDSLGRLHPLNLYGWSKHLFDRFVAHEVESLRPTPPQWVGLKYFNVYGPNEYHKGSMQSVVAHLFPKVMAGEPAKLFKSYNNEYSDGQQQRDFVYVQDCVSVVLWLLENPKVSGVYNVGTGTSRSFFDLATFTMSAAGLTPKIEFVDMPVELRNRYQYFTQAVTTNLRGAGYHLPFTSLEEGVREYVQQFFLSDKYR